MSPSGLTQRTLASLPLGQRGPYLTRKLREGRARLAVKRPIAIGPLLAQRARVERAIFSALRRYIPGHFAGRVSLFLPSKQWVDSREEPLRWRAVAQHSDEYFGPDGCHTDVMLLEPYAPGFAELFRQSRARSINEARSRVGKNSFEFA